MQRIDGQLTSQRSVVDGTGDTVSRIQADDKLSSALDALLDELFASIRAAALRTKNPVPLINSLRMIVEQVGTSGQEADA